jgi:adenylate cyclase
MDIQARMSSEDTYQAGDLWIDVGRQIVLGRNGVQIPLPRLSFDLLVALARAHPKLLTVEELMDHVWSPAVVNPETVGQRVKLLRHSLGEDPRNPRYIVGVRGRGYRMDAAVTRGPSISVDRGVAALRSAAISRATAASRALGVLVRRRPWSLVFAGILLVLAAAGIDRFWSHKTEDSSLVAAASPRSVAVLPFVDLSEKGDQGFFADGLTDELINRLATIPGIDVAAKTSSFHFKGKQAAIHDVAKALRVAHILEGSVRTSGKELRITAELVRIDNGYHVWSGSFDQPLSDIFKVQDKITAAVIQALKLSLVDHYTPRVVTTENIEAYTLYLRAVSNFGSNGSDDYDAAVEQLRAALGLDSQFADAWALLSMAILFKGNTHGTPAAAACAAARAAANQALTLNARLEEGHRAAGAIFQYCDANLAAAEAEFNRAIEVAPERDDALRSYAWLLVDAGRFNQAQRLAQLAVDRDPLNAWNYVALGDSYWRSGHVSAAEMAYQKAVQLNPTTASLHALYANVLLSAHKPVAAVAEAEREPDPQYRQLTLPIALDAAGRKGDADQEIAAYESIHSEDDPGEVAVFYACRNDSAQAIKWLGKFAAKHAGGFASLPNRIACFKNIESNSQYILLQQQVRQEIPTLPLTAKVRSFRHADFLFKP